MENLKAFFISHPKCAVAFSGGVDSSFLLYSAKKYAKEVRAYFVKSEFQPEFEYKDAENVASLLGVELTPIPLSVLSLEEIRKNPENRCYFCKKCILGAITARMKADGFSLLLDGTNASDDLGDRPGAKALHEFSVLSPLRECGFAKERIREEAEKAGLPTWKKPAYACLATRIPHGERITEEKLRCTEKGENILFSLGFSDFRIRYFQGCAKIQITKEDFSRMITHREEVLAKLRPLYKDVVLDLEERKS